MLTEFFNEISSNNYPYIWPIIASVLGYVFCLAAIPSILFVSHEKQLVAKPEERSSHRKPTPTLGGVAIYLSLMLVMTFIGAFWDTKIILLVMGGITILFFFGLKDDLANISVFAKVLGQLAAIGLLIFLVDTRITSFSGIFGIHDLGYLPSALLTFFVFILLINAFNLIDGIDGLAGGVALSSSLVLGVLSYLESQFTISVISAAMFGAIVAFLRFNFSVERKLFMGDTGSLVIGYVMAFLTIRFIHSEQYDTGMHYYSSAPIIAFALMFYPIADTARVFFLRLFKYKRNPFTADRNHIHHHFTNLGYSHKRSSAYIVAINLAIVSIAFLLRNLNINIQLIALLIYGPLLYSSTFAVRKVKDKVRQRNKKPKMEQKKRSTKRFKSKAPSHY